MSAARARARAFDDFDALEEDEECPYEFKLGGKWWQCRPQSRVTYKLIRQLSEVPEDGRGAIVQVDTFFEGVLVPEQVEAFMKLVEAKGSALTVDKLQPLMQRISEEVLNRPTERSSSSEAGSRSTRATSRANSSRQATRKARSA